MIYMSYVEPDTDTQIKINVSFRMPGKGTLRKLEPFAIQRSLEGDFRKSNTF